jgi:membrane protein required for colicin V production
MIWVDYLIVGIIGISALIGLARGLIREVVSLVVWVAAVYVAWMYHREVADQLIPWISTPSVRVVLAFVILVLTVLIAGTLVGYLLSTLVEKTGLTGTDRLLGSLFGAGRGVVLVAMLVFLGALTPLHEDPWWKQSALIGRFQVLANRVVAEIPPDAVDQFKKVEGGGGLRVPPKVRPVGQ